MATRIVDEFNDEIAALSTACSYVMSHGPSPTKRQRLGSPQPSRPSSQPPELPDTKHPETADSTTIRSGALKDARTAPVLPVEVLDYTLRWLPNRSDLLPCLLVNSVLHGIALRILYHSLYELEPAQSVLCLRTLLARRAALAPLVRSLELDWSQTTPTLNLYRLLHRALHVLTRLTTLHLELPRAHAPTWVFAGCAFALRSFSTSMPCKRALAEFLDAQPSITDLALRGFQNDDPYGLPFIAPLQSVFDFGGGGGAVSEGSSSQAVGSSDNPNAFVLKPASLPRLTQFRTVHAGPSIIAEIAKDRPLKLASIPLFPALASQTLKALQLSSEPLRRLSIMSFDPTAQDFLLSEIAERFPDLEALHLVILLTEYTDDLLKASGPLLAGFKSLQYLTFMAATDESSPPEEEQAIAKLWHRWCPTLKTIILPRGKVWFDGGSEWSCVEDEKE